MQAPIAPTWIFPGQAQYQRSDRVHGARPASALWSGLGGVPAGDEVTVPPQRRVRPHRQSHPAQHLSRQAVERDAKNARPLAWNQTYCPFSCRSKTTI
jgi:hypothetical protein